MKNKVSIEEKFYEYPDILTPYGIVARYPDELFFEENHAADAVRYAEEIMQWTKELIDMKSLEISLVDDK